MAKKTVLAVMRELGLACRVRRRRRYVSYQGQVGAVAANILDRQFTAAAPNEKWVTDVTEFRVGEAKLYLSPVMDLFDRQIISYSIGRSPTTEFTNRSLRAALGTLGEQECPIVHSDQGFHYAPAEYYDVKITLPDSAYWRIFFTARNGQWHQDLILKRSDADSCWLAATRVVGLQQAPQMQQLDHEFIDRFGEPEWLP
ncbi:DDE-type integrase/transposase/recombinase [Rhodococcoides fascians]|uniref:DDE-type integrase/transposase/recombinase n=1 Tax=Rhodococcoides fascians TaxID=1828 RepID=UPI00068F1A7F|nr:DDE-type integrase/transposase/recombinase [Rhodococcus fascians]